jgi:dienelactone hydrolase
MKRFVFPSLMLAILLAACAAPATPTPTAVPTPAPTAVPTQAIVFDYDASIPFDVKVNTETEQDGAIVTELSYAAHAKSFAPRIGGRTVAYVVRPADEQGSFAGVVFLHWLSSNRKQFLDEAVVLAKRGVVSLLMQGQVPYMQSLHFDTRDVALAAGQTMEMRRGIDFLVAQPGVDAERIGVVGHGYGAMYTALLSGVDARPKTFVIVAGWPVWENAAAITFSANADDYKMVMAPVQPVDFVGQASAAPILFQFGEKSAVSPEDANNFHDAVTGPKEMRWYPTDGSMSIEQVWQDRVAWLAEKLGLPTE